MIFLDSVQEKLANTHVDSKPIYDKSTGAIHHYRLTVHGKILAPKRNYKDAIVDMLLHCPDGMFEGKAKFHSWTYFEQNTKAVFMFECDNAKRLSPLEIIRKRLHANISN